MTLHSFLTFARDLSARAWRWTRRNGHALAAYIAARTHAGAAYLHASSAARPATAIAVLVIGGLVVGVRSEEHTSELQSLMSISYAVFCLQKKTIKTAKENN